MGYYISIIENELKCNKDVSEKLQELGKEEKLRLPWYWSETHVKTDDTCFKWTDNFVDDLFILQTLGVRGCLVTHGEEDDYYRYVIDDKAVKEYLGRIVFPRNRYRIMKRDLNTNRKDS
jgi:hypothetical protein